MIAGGPRTVTGPDGQVWRVEVVSGRDDGDVYLANGSMGKDRYVLRRLPYLLGLRSDVRLIVTRDHDRAKRRLLDQHFPDEQSAESAAEGLVRAITSGTWPVA
jgi:hypothetical protein